MNSSPSSPTQTPIVMREWDNEYLQKLNDYYFEERVSIPDLAKIFGTSEYDIRTQLVDIFYEYIVEPIFEDIPRHEQVGILCGHMYRLLKEQMRYAPSQINRNTPSETPPQTPEPVAVPVSTAKPPKPPPKEKKPKKTVEPVVASSNTSTDQKDPKPVRKQSAKKA
jgi:hypothetical protein